MARERITLDTADQPVNMPFGVVLSNNGETLYVINAGSNDLSIIDLASGRAIGHVSVGINPRGIAIAPDGSRVFVNNVLDGSVTVVDTAPNSVETIISVSDIPLTPQVLLDKKFFNSSLEPKLSTDN